MDKATKAVLDKLQSQVGVREERDSHGNWTNTGPQVRQYQAATTLGGTGWPWCVALLGWAFLEALGKPLCDQVWLRSASCDAILDWARRHDLDTTEPTPGCMGLVLASANNATHGFSVRDVLAKGVLTVEGNTNTDGSREGNGVYDRERKFSSRLLYIDWMKLLPASYKIKGAVVAVPEPTEAPVGPFQNAPLRELWAGGHKLMDVPMVAGRVWVPAWKWAAWFNQKLGWDVESQAVTLNGKEVPAQPILFETRAWLPVRSLADFAGLDLALDGNKVVISK